MGKKGSSANKKGPMTRVQQAPSITLREESYGKQHKPLSVKSMLKFDHIKNLALWAGVEASIPSLSAFFGHRLAATAEALDVPPDPSLFSCQRCDETYQLLSIYLFVSGSNCVTYGCFLSYMRLLCFSMIRTKLCSCKIRTSELGKLEDKLLSSAFELHVLDQMNLSSNIASLIKGGKKCESALQSFES